MYYHKYKKYKSKYRKKLEQLHRSQQGGREEGDPTRKRVPDSYANYPPSPAGARMLQSQLYKQMGNAVTDSSKSKGNMTSSTSIQSAADPQRSGEIVESCLTNCFKDCNYGFPLCISTNMGSFAQTARNLQSLMGAQKGPSSSSGSGSSTSGSSGMGGMGGMGAEGGF